MHTLINDTQSVSFVKGDHKFCLQGDIKCELQPLLSHIQAKRALRKNKNLTRCL